MKYAVTFHPLIGDSLTYVVEADCNDCAQWMAATQSGAQLTTVKREGRAFTLWERDAPLTGGTTYRRYYRF